MSQTVRISAGYSDKASENYQSRQFSLNLELDVQVNGSTLEIESASNRLFDLCRKIVEGNKSISVDNLLQRPEQPVQLLFNPACNNEVGKDSFCYACIRFSICPQGLPVTGITRL